VDGALVAVQHRLVGEVLLALVAREPAAVQQKTVNLIGVSVVGLKNI
jgi:hypothetical protein